MSYQQDTNETKALAWSPWMTLGLYASIYAMDFFCQSLLLFAVTFFIVAHSPYPLEPQTVISTLSHSGPFFVMLSFVSALTVTSALLVLIRRRGSSLSEYLAIRRIDVLPAMGWIAIGIGFALVQTALYSWLKVPSTDFWDSIVHGAELKPLLFLSMVIISPAIEEMLYRGFLFRGLLHSRLGGWGAVLISAFAWAGAHLQYNWYEKAAIFFLGCILGAIRLRKDSLSLTFLVHAGVNLAGWVFLILS
jgi:membrane protease YdiL (CAAX protease family)